MSIKYSSYKIFHFKDKLDSLPADVPQILPPVHIRVKPTNFCNHNCWYCAYKKNSLQLGEDMNERDMIPKEKMFEIIDDCADMGVKAITFSGGGEPFCYPHLKETTQRLAEKGIKCAALTNGSLLKGDIAKIFAEHASWLRISIDGWDDESYAAYRSVKHGEFSKVIGNLRDFAALGGKCYLGVSFIMDNKNYAHVFEFSKMMKDIGVNSIKLSPCIVSNDGKKNREYHEPVFDTAKAEVERVKEQLEDGSFEVFNSYHAQMETFDKEYHWCPYLQINPVIGADQRIYTCHDKAYNLKTGVINTLHDKSFKQAWNESKEQFFAVDPSRDCAHHCVVHGKNQIILDYLNNDPEHIAFV